MTTEQIWQQYKEEHNTYKAMVEYCTGSAPASLILANTTFEAMASADCSVWENLDCGELEEDENGDYIYPEFFQFFIIDERAARYFKEYTNEAITYSEIFDTFYLCVSHFGTAWDGVPANWK